MAAFEIARPEIFLLIAICIVLLIDIFFGKESKVVTYLATQASLLSTALLVYTSSFSKEAKLVGLDRMYVVDELAGVLKIAIIMLASLAFVYGRKYIRDQNMWRGEFFVLGMTSVLGMMIMVSGYNLLVLYLGLELSALSMYALVAIQRDDIKATEAAMKYFVLGATGSGLLLYGMSMLYGMTGGLGITHLNSYFSAQTDIYAHIPALFALTFIVAGLAFKLGVVPFHMWLPDVYQGAPTAVTLFLGSAPKIATFALLIRLLAEGLAPIDGAWGQMLLVLALASVVFGNIVAVAQTNLKRMFAYSTIAHMGFMLMGIVTSSHMGYSAAMFYILVYAATSAAGFAVLIILGHQGYDPEDLADLKGLHARNPWIAFLMMIILLTMLGFPLTVGFYAKLAIVQAVVNQGLVVAAVIMVVMSVIGAFYYLRVIKMMYFDEPTTQEPLSVSFDMYSVFSLNSLGLLLLGIFPGGLMALCSNVLTASQL